MSSPSKQLEGLIVAGKILHGGHEVLTWQAGNVAIQRDGAADNIKPSKARSTERIDGIVSLVMAIGIHATATAPPPEQNWDIVAI
jgi:phage terminase large subunit-like protein